MLGVAAAIGAEALGPGPSLSDAARGRVEEGVERLAELGKRPGLSLRGNTAGVREKVPFLTAKGVPAILRECLDDPLAAPKHADRIFDGFLCARSADDAARFAASLLGRAPADVVPEPLSVELAGRIAALPDRIREALARFLETAGPAHAACRAACETVSPGEMRTLAGRFLSVAGDPLLDDAGMTRRLGIDPAAVRLPVAGHPAAIFHQIDRDRLAGAAVSFTRACRELADAMKVLPTAALDGAASPDERKEIGTPWGLLVLAGRGSTRHPPPDPKRPVLLAVDLGGHDAWEGAWGAASGPDGHFLGGVIDLAGDDLYLADVANAFGSGYFGVGVLLDLAGDDRYEAEDFSLGCGLGGWGIAWDAAGNDTWRGTTHSQGCGAFGYGLLLDGAGRDRYRADLDSQGFGFCGSVGVLADARGDDLYQAGGRFTDDIGESPERIGRYKARSQGFGWGWRPQATGGIGALLDGGGNDLYDLAQSGMGQGTGYWFSFGLLYDAAGDDLYDANYYAQGVGHHFGTGVLADRAGNDAYKLTGGGGQCWGHDYGVAWLVESGGDDRYAISRTPAAKGFRTGSGQGGGNLRGIGVFLECAGDDTYDSGPDWTPEDVVRMYQVREEKGARKKLSGDEIVARRRGIGIRLDLAGRDRYAPSGQDGTDRLRMIHALDRDLE